MSCIAENSALDARTIYMHAKILAHLPLVRAIAVGVSRKYRSNLELEDLVNVGTIGLMEALDRYDEARGVPFKPFAEMRIRGAMVDAIRKADWVPRVVRRRNHLINSTRAAMRTRLQRDPTRAEMAQALGLTDEELSTLELGAVTRSTVSFELALGDGEGTLAEVLVAEEETSLMDTWIAAEERDLLAEAIESLPADERLVMSLYYERDMKYREIAALMAITQSRVCQLRTQAVARLRKRLAFQEVRGARCVA